MPNLKERPQYEALDKIGLPYMRKALVIGELEQSEIKPALDEATQTLAAKIGIEAIHPIKFGTPAFCAFKGMNRNTAKRHPEAATLLKHGDELSLDLCPGYEPEELVEA